MVDLVDAQIFRAQQDMQTLAGLHGKIDGDVAFSSFNAGTHALFVETFNYRGVKDIDLADKAGDKQVLRLFVDLSRGAVLFDFAITHHHDAIGHGQSLFLIVGDEDEGDPELTLQRFQFVLHLLAQLVIQCRKRLIEQQQTRFVDHRAGDGHALLLAAGELVRFALGKRLQLHHL